MKTIEFPSQKQIVDGALKLGKAGVLIVALQLASCTAPKPVDSNAAKLANPVPTTEQITTTPKIPAEIRPTQVDQILTKEGELIAQKLNEKLAQKTADGRNEEVVENDLESQEIKPNPDKDILIFLVKGDKVKLSVATQGNLFMRHKTGEFLVAGIDNGLKPDKRFMNLGNTDSVSLFSKDRESVQNYYKFIQNGRAIIIDVSLLVNDPFIVDQLIKKLKAFNEDDKNNPKIHLLDELGEGFDHLADKQTITKSQGLSPEQLKIRNQEILKRSIQDQIPK